MSLSRSTWTSTSPPSWVNFSVTLVRVSYTNSFPWSIIATSSHTSETSFSRWELMKTSRFFCLRLFTMSLTSAWPRGSRPVVGSSKRTMSGSVRSAVATLILCFMPLENLPTFLSIHSSIFTSATTASTRFARSWRGTPLISEIIESASLGVRAG